MTGSSREMGIRAESDAAEMLRREGFTVLASNYRLGRYGEIDIIARKDDLVVFVEVKSRATGAFGGGLFSIPESKKRKMRKAAAGYIAADRALNTREITFRFDLVYFQGGELRWLPDMFR